MWTIMTTGSLLNISSSFKWCFMCVCGGWVGRAQTRTGWTLPLTWLLHAFVWQTFVGFLGVYALVLPVVHVIILNNCMLSVGVLRLPNPVLYCAMQVAGNRRPFRYHYELSSESWWDCSFERVLLLLKVPNVLLRERFVGSGIWCYQCDFLVAPLSCVLTLPHWWWDFTRLRYINEVVSRRAIRTSF